MKVGQYFRFSLHRQRYTLSVKKMHIKTLLQRFKCVRKSRSWDSLFHWLWGSGGEKGACGTERYALLLFYVGHCFAYTQKQYALYSESGYSEEQLLPMQRFDFSTAEWSSVTTGSVDRDRKGNERKRSKLAAGGLVSCAVIVRTHLVGVGSMATLCTS